MFFVSCLFSLEGNLSSKLGYICRQSVPDKWWRMEGYLSQARAEADKIAEARKTIEAYEFSSKADAQVVMDLCNQMKHPQDELVGLLAAGLREDERKRKEEEEKRSESERQKGSQDAGAFELTPELHVKLRSPEFATLEADKDDVKRFRDMVKDDVVAVVKKGGPRTVLQAWIKLHNLIKYLGVTKKTACITLHMKLDSEARNKLGAQAIRDPTSFDAFQSAFENSCQGLSLDAASIYRATRKQGERLQDAIRRMVDEADLLLLCGELTESSVAQFLVSPAFLGGTYPADNATKLAEVRSKMGPRSKWSLADLTRAVARAWPENGGDVPEKTGRGPGAATTTAGWESVPPALPVSGQSPQPSILNNNLCRTCKHRGHISAYCPTLSDHARAKLDADYKKKQRAREQQDRAEINAGPSHYSSAALAGDGGMLDVRGWVLDPSGASGMQVVISLDTQANAFFIRESAVPSGARVRSEQVQVTGIGQARSLGTVSLALDFAAEDGRRISAPAGDFIVMAEDSLPRQVIVPVWAVRVDWRLAFDYAQGDSVSLMGHRLAAVTEDGRLLPGGAPASLRLEEAINQPAPDMSEVEVTMVQEVLGRPADALGGECGGDEPEEGPESLPDIRPDSLEDTRAALEKYAFGPGYDAPEPYASRLKELVMGERYIRIFRDKFDASARNSNPPVEIRTAGRVPRQPYIPMVDEQLKAFHHERMMSLLEAGVWRYVRPGEIVEGPMNAFSTYKDLAKTKVRTIFSGKPLNGVTVKNQYPMQDSWSFLQHARGAKWLTSIDEKDCFYQFRIREEDQGKTAFYVGDGRVGVYNVLPMGWSNSPGVAHEFKDRKLQGSGIAFKDYSYTFDDSLLMTQADEPDPDRSHFDTIIKYLEMCVENGIFLSPAKFFPFRRELEHQGFVLDTVSKQYYKSEEAVRPIMELPVPQTRKDLQEFLSCMQAYGVGVARLQQTAAPLTALLKKGAFPRGGLDADLAEVVQELKRLLAEQTRLAMPDFTKPFHLVVDSQPASGIGSAVCQPDSAGMFRPLAFASRRSTAPEKNYWSPEMELRGMAWAYAKFRHWLAGRTVWIWNDGQSVRDMMQQRSLLNPQAERRLLRDASVLEAGDIRFVHVKRSDPYIVMVDKMSREAAEPGGASLAALSLESGDPGFTVRTDSVEYQLLVAGCDQPGVPIDIVDEQKVDPFCQYIRKMKAGASDAELAAMRVPESVIQRVTSYRDKDPGLERIQDEGGRLYYKGPDDRRRRIIIPQLIRERVLQAYHNTALGGHVGRKRTIEALRTAGFFWVGLSRDVGDYVRACDTCSMIKTPQRLYKGLVPVAKGRPWDRVQIDFLTVSPESRRGHKYVLTVLDLDSGRTRVLTFVARHGREVARRLYEEVFLPRGVLPSVMHSDNGREFIAGLLKQLNVIMGVHGVSGTPYAPNVQGAVEGRNKFILRFLAWMCEDDLESWDLYAPYVEGAIATHVYEPTGVTPVFYETGYDPISPLEHQLDNPPEEKSETLEAFIQRVKRARDIAQLSTEEAATIMARQADKRRVEHKFEVGTEVFLFFPKRSRSSKLAKAWYGPYKILEFLGHGRAARIESVKNKREVLVVSVDRLTLRHKLPKNWKPGPDYEKFIQIERKALSDNEWELDDPDRAAEDSRMVSQLDDDEFEISDIVDHKVIKKSRTTGKGKRKREESYNDIDYRVRFLGCAPDADLWIPEDQLLDTAPALLREYMVRVGLIAD